jgi:hypothetical protein
MLSVLVAQRGHRGAEADGRDEHVGQLDQVDRPAAQPG